VDLDSRHQPRQSASQPLHLSRGQHLTQVCYDPPYRGRHLLQPWQRLRLVGREQLLLQTLRTRLSRAQTLRTRAEERNGAKGERVLPT
jgi:hypothetical protein